MHRVRDVRSLDADGDGRLSPHDFDAFVLDGKLPDGGLAVLGFSERDTSIEDLATHFYSNVLLGGLTLVDAAEGEQPDVLKS
jgi:hypothetical protein